MLYCRSSRHNITYNPTHIQSLFILQPIFNSHFHSNDVLTFLITSLTGIWKASISKKFTQSVWIGSSTMNLKNAIRTAVLCTVIEGSTMKGFTLIQCGTTPKFFITLVDAGKACIRSQMISEKRKESMNGCYELGTIVNGDKCQRPIPSGNFVSLIMFCCIHSKSISHHCSLR